MNMIFLDYVAKVRGISDPQKLFKRFSVKFSITVHFSIKFSIFSSEMHRKKVIAMFQQYHIEPCHQLQVIYLRLIQSESHQLIYVNQMIRFHLFAILWARSQRGADSYLGCTCRPSVNALRLNNKKNTATSRFEGIFTLSPGLRCKDRGGVPTLYPLQLGTILGTNPLKNQN